MTTATKIQPNLKKQKSGCVKLIQLQFGLAEYIIKIDMWYPSSKTYSLCSYKLEKLDLGTNAAENILRVDQIDSTRSQTTGDLEPKVPMALQKMTNGHGSGQAA